MDSEFFLGEESGLTKTHFRRSTGSDPNGTIFHLGDFPKGIQCIRGDQVSGSLIVGKRHENTALRHSGIFLGKRRKASSS